MVDPFQDQSKACVVPIPASRSLWA
jgi:hypothetical protein